MVDEREETAKRVSTREMQDRIRPLDPDPRKSPISWIILDADVSYPVLFLSILPS